MKLYAQSLIILFIFISITTQAQTTPFDRAVDRYIQRWIQANPCRRYNVEIRDRQSRGMLTTFSLIITRNVDNNPICHRLIFDKAERTIYPAQDE